MGEISAFFGVKWINVYHRGWDKWGGTLKKSEKISK
jgi:hypothetical protein